MRIDPHGFVEREGKIVSRDLAISLGDQMYILSVGIAEYINHVRIFNQSQPSDKQLYDNILIVESVEDIDMLRTTLNNIPWDVIQPFLVKQDDESNEEN